MRPFGASSILWVKRSNRNSRDKSVMSYLRHHFQKPAMNTKHFNLCECIQEGRLWKGIYGVLSEPSPPGVEAGRDVGTAPEAGAPAEAAAAIAMLLFPLGIAADAGNGGTFVLSTT